MLTCRQMRSASRGTARLKLRQAQALLSDPSSLVLQSSGPRSLVLAAAPGRGKHRPVPSCGRMPLLMDFLLSISMPALQLEIIRAAIEHLAARSIPAQLATLS